MSCISFCKTKCCCWRCCCPTETLCNCSLYFLNNPWISPLILIDLYYCNFIFLPWCIQSKAFMTIFNHKKKPLQPLSYLLFVFIDEGHVSGFLGVLISSLLYPIPDLSFGDLWLSKKLSRVMELFKNLLWVFDFSTFKTYSSSLWHDYSPTSSMG